MQRPRVTVLGAGSWGTALAALACQQADTVLWGRDASLARHMQQQGENPRYLPGIALPSALRVTCDLAVALDHVCPPQEDPLQDAQRGLILLGVPVAGLLALCTQLAPRLIHPAHPPAVVCTCKGFEPDTARLPHEMVQAAFASINKSTPEKIPGLGILSGPSFAREVAQRLPVALTIASAQPSVCQTVIRALHGPNARIYSSVDIIGTEVGGALKNIVAIACGISDALGLGANARAALITRGLAEMQRLGVALGGQAHTFSGLTGLGDLVLTATGDLSRNRQLGLKLGQGAHWADLAKEGTTTEGARCARAAMALGEKYGVDLPITRAVCMVLFDGVSPREAVTQLLARAARPEPEPL